MSDWMPKDTHKEYANSECLYEDWLEDDGKKERFCEDLRHQGFAEGCEQTVRKLIEWGTAFCTNGSHEASFGDCPRFRCPLCMEQLKEAGK